MECLRVCREGGLFLSQGEEERGAQDEVSNPADRKSLGVTQVGTREREPFVSRRSWRRLGWTAEEVGDGEQGPRLRGHSGTLQT